MKLSTICILAGLACILLLAAGCTSMPGTRPVVTINDTTSAVTPTPPTAATALSVTGTGNSTTTSDTLNETSSGTPAISRVNAARPPLTRPPK